LFHHYFTLYHFKNTDDDKNYLCIHVKGDRYKIFFLSGNIKICKDMKMEVKYMYDKLTSSVKALP